MTTNAHIAILLIIFMEIRVKFCINNFEEESIYMREELQGAAKPWGGLANVGFSVLLKDRPGQSRISTPNPLVYLSPRLRSHRTRHFNSSVEICPATMLSTIWICVFPLTLYVIFVCKLKKALKQSTSTCTHTHTPMPLVFMFQQSLLCKTRPGGIQTATECRES